MVLTTVAVVGFTLAKIILRFTEWGTAADAADDLMDGASRVLTLKKRRLAKSLAADLADGIASVSTHGLQEHDRRAALESVDQLLRQIGDDLAVQAIVDADQTWLWALEHGGQQFRASLGGASGDYFELLLRHCVDAVKRTSPGSGFQTAADVRLLTQAENLRQQMAALGEDLQGSLRRILAGEPARQDSLQLVMAASRSYARELALLDGLYVARTLESELLKAITDQVQPWPRVIVGEAGAGKSTLLGSLNKELSRGGFDPVVISAAWMLSQAQRGDDVVRAAMLLAEFASPVLLFDTVDLLLHQEEQRRMLLTLMEQLCYCGVPAVYATRPLESPLIHHPELRATELGLYDDAELRQATTALVARYCPAAPRATTLGSVEHAVARGLPAADVCRSPLLLRMLFEASSPDAPEFEDLDVTSLYGGYWDRRIVRDARNDVAIAMRSSQHENLSAIASSTAVALLIRGLPQDREGTVRAIAECVDPRTPPVMYAEGVDRLKERGVLETGKDQISFFHQTMFEYSFARWWGASRDPDVLRKLVERTMGGQGDLFVGAALEQTLILEAREAGGTEMLRAACQQLVASEWGSIHAIALAAWAHRPSAIQPAQTLLSQCDDAALARSARLLPSVAGKPVGEVISQLMLIWEARNSATTRIAVLRAFARVALRDSQTVVYALEELYPAGGLPPVTEAIQSASESSLIRAAQSLSDVDSDLLAGAFVELFEHLQPGHATVVRRLCTSLLRRGDTASSVILEYLQTHWRENGSGDLLHEVMHAVGFPSLRTSLMEPCGKLLAEEWLRDAETQGRSIDVDGLLVDPDDRYGPSVEVFARAALAAKVNGAELERLVTSLLGERDEWLAEARIGLSALLYNHPPAMQCIVGLAQAALLQLRAGELTWLGRNTLTFLGENQLSDLVYHGALSDVSIEEWVRYPELTPLWVGAASAGVPSAQEALKEVANAPQEYSRNLISILLSSRPAVSISSDVVFEQVLSLALSVREMEALNSLLAGTSLKKNRAVVVHELLRNHTEDLSPLVILSCGELVPWSTSLKALRTESVKFQADVLANLWKRREDDDTDVERTAYLKSIVLVDPAAEIPVDKAAPNVPLSVLVNAARSLHYICSLRQSPIEDDWSVILTMTLYPPLDPTRTVLGQSFAATLRWLENLGAQANTRMPEHLLELLENVVTADFIGITTTLWERELTNAINYAVSIAGPNLAVRLCKVSAVVHPELALVIVSRLAERWFATVRNELIRIGQDTRNQELSELCQHLVREGDRSGGSRAFPDLIPALARRLRELVR